MVQRLNAHLWQITETVTLIEMEPNHLCGVDRLQETKERDSEDVCYRRRLKMYVHVR